MNGIVKWTYWCVDCNLYCKVVSILEFCYCFSIENRVLIHLATNSKLCLKQYCNILFWFWFVWSRELFLQWLDIRMSLRDRFRLSDRFRSKLADELIDEITKEFENNKRSLFDPDGSRFRLFPRVRNISFPYNSFEYYELFQQSAFCSLYEIFGL